MSDTYFKYGEKEIAYLKSRDKKLGEIIDKLGIIQAPIIPDVLSSLSSWIIGQQISAKAYDTIWQRFQDTLGSITPETVLSLSDDEMQSIGMSFRKVEYIKNIARRIQNKEIILENLQKMTDDEVCTELSKFKGIGPWSAEMMLIFTFNRMNVLSYGDFGILKGMRMLYHHKEISKERFQKYRKRYSPYASVASLYLWAIAEGELPEIKDYPSKKP